MLSPKTWAGIGAGIVLLLVAIYASQRPHPALPTTAARSAEDGVALETGHGTLTDRSKPGPGVLAGEASSTAATPAAPQAVATSTAAAAPTAVVASKSSAPGGTIPIAAPASGAGAMPYRPAKLLRYSDELPAKTGAGDDASPVLKRVLDVVQPDDKQKNEIIDLWHAHEDARRALLAAAPPRLSGPPIADPTKSAENDFKFESTLFMKVLSPNQRDRLAAEIYPQDPKRR